MNKTKKSFKISTTLLMLFFIVIGIVAVSMLSLQYYFGVQLAKEATQNSVKIISKNIFSKIDEINKMNNDTISLLELSHNIEDKPIKNKKHPLLEKFVAVMNDKKYLYAMYTGYENGNFYEVINLNIDEKLRIKYNTTKKERWLVLKIVKKNNQVVKIEEYLDAELNIVRSVQKETQYNPVKRPWYKKALYSKSMVKTDPYMFSNLESMGVTYSKKMKGSNTVIGIDISLKSLSKLLQSQEVIKYTQLYIFDKNNQEIIASNNEIIENKEKTIKELNNLIDDNLQKITLHNIDYLVNSVYLEANEYFVMLLNKKEMMKPYNRKIYFSIWANLILMLIVLPIIWYLSKIIINPMKLLIKENEKIKNRKFNDVTLLDSRIKEINALSHSIVSMSQSIQNYEEAQVKLMDAFIEVITSAIDAKSEYTAGHGQRVPIITMMLAKKASEKNDGIFEEFSILDEDKERELKIAALLHDCGKITTPEYVVDKATKLETIYNRIHEVRTRFEVVYRDLEIKYYQELLNGKEEKELNSWLEKEKESLKSDFGFIAMCNIGGEFMRDEYIERIKKVSSITWKKNFDDTLGLSQDEMDRLSHEDNSEIEYILSDKQNHIIKRTRYFQEEFEKDGFKGKVPDNLYNLGEIYNLTVRKGTLTNEERFKINEHMIMTIKMLEQLPLPEQLKRIPEYAGAHHETLIGTGYPKQLTKEDMSIPARIMAIADIFEALTASDRPYKEPKKLSESIKILSFMVKDQHIDRDIFELFLTSGVYKEYGIQYLKPEQIDEVDISKYLS